MNIAELECNKKGIITTHDFYVFGNSWNIKQDQRI